MPISSTPATERIARVLAGQRLSINGQGDDESVARDVDAAWPEYRDDALAVLRTLREPDSEMANAGDAAIWERMVCAALGETSSIARSADNEVPEPGTDSLHEGP